MNPQLLDGRLSEWREAQLNTQSPGYLQCEFAIAPEQFLTWCYQASPTAVHRMSSSAKRGIQGFDGFQRRKKIEEWLISQPLLRERPLPIFFLPMRTSRAYILIVVHFENSTTRAEVTPIACCDQSLSSNHIQLLRLALRVWFDIAKWPSIRFSVRDTMSSHNELNDLERVVERMTHAMHQFLQYSSHSEATQREMLHSTHAKGRTKHFIQYMEQTSYVWCKTSALYTPTYVIANSMAQTENYAAVEQIIANVRRVCKWMASPANGDGFQELFGSFPLK